MSRRYWKCRCGEPGSYAVDDFLGIDGRLSKTVRKHACRLSADTSFAAASEHLREMLGVRACAETIRTVVESHGREMAAFQPSDPVTAESFRKAPGEVEFAVDAGKVNTREEGWKDLKIAVISKREAAKPALPAEWDSRTLPAATMVLAFAMIATAKTFRRSWRGWLRRLGLASFAAVHVLGDGAGWIWKSAGRSLTGCRQTLDVFHAAEHISKAATRIFGECTAETKGSFERGRSLLIEQGWPGVCLWVGELLSVTDEIERERRRKITDSLMGYFANHVSKMEYARLLAEGRSIGSGAVEGWAKTLGIRLKRRGARWNRANVQPMASLVCVRHTAQWDAYWANAV